MLFSTNRKPRWSKKMGISLVVPEKSSTLANAKKRFRTVGLLAVFIYW
jgi:hypothetical protein